MKMFTILTKPLRKKRYIYYKSKKTFRKYYNKNVFKKGRRKAGKIMYFNDVHILVYVLAIIIGGILGQFIDYASKCFMKDKKIFDKKNFEKYKKTMLPNYLIIATISIGYVALIYKFGIQKNFMDNFTLLKYIILLPMLTCAFYVDLKEQIIPNRLNLLIFEFGLLFMFLEGFININIALNMLIGMFAGAGIFLLIAFVGGIIAGKEAMGMGDVKLMGGLGLFFGLQNIVLISVMAFLIGAIVSVIYMIIKRTTSNVYIPFGPFIVSATIITIFVPFSVLFKILMEVFSLGLY